jgi:hypothetical protein
MSKGSMLQRIDRWWQTVPPPSTLQLGMATAAVAVVFKLLMMVSCPFPYSMHASVVLLP